MKKLFNLTSLLFALGVCSLSCLTGCSDDNGTVGEDPTTPDELVFEWNLDVETATPILLVSDETYTIAYHGEGVESLSPVNTPTGWQVSIDEEAGQITVTAPSSTAEADKNYSLQLALTGADNQSTMTENIDFYHVTFDDPAGTFVLNEGNMTTENGSLIYITPEGYVLDDAYKRVNGTELGNVTQDMCFHDGKIYIISQNGDTIADSVYFENDGMLVVADATTLKKIRNFTNEELSQLDWPTHIAVTDEQHVYIRDNVGVWHLNMDDGSLAFVNGTSGAPKNRFVVLNEEVYFANRNNEWGNSIQKIDPTTDQVSTVGMYALFDAFPMINTVLGIAPAEDGNLWLIGSTARPTSTVQGIITLGKLDISTSEPTLVQNALSEQPDEVYDCCFATHGNTIYYAHGTTIYRATFNPERAGGEIVDEMLLDLASLDNNVGLLYNGLGVNPRTGHVFINSLRGYGNFFTTNSIWEFDFDASLDTPVHKYDNYLHFPAGIFFNK